jgi:hypothetical protein
VKSSSRLLIGFGLGLAVVVIITVVLALSIGQKNAPPLSADSPEGTVQQFLLAVQSKDYAAAYKYLIPPSTQPDVNTFQGSFEYFSSSAQNVSNNTWKANLGKTSLQGDTASVEIILEVFTSGGPFGNPIRSNTIIFFLKKTGNTWLISSPTDLYWLY